MKKLILLISIVFLTGIAYAQEKPKYKKNVIIPVEDFGNLKTSIDQWKRLCVYDPSLSAEQKVGMIQNLESYTNTLLSIVRLDSVMIKPDSVVVSKSKKK